VIACGGLFLCWQTNSKSLFLKLRAAFRLYKGFKVVVPLRHRHFIMSHAKEVGFEWLGEMVAKGRVHFAKNVLELLEYGVEGEYCDQLMSDPSIASYRQSHHGAPRSLMWCSWWLTDCDLSSPLPPSPVAPLQAFPGVTSHTMRPTWVSGLRVPWPSPQGGTGMPFKGIGWSWRP